MHLNLPKWFQIYQTARKFTKTNEKLPSWAKYIPNCLKSNKTCKIIPKCTTINLPSGKKPKYAKVNQNTITKTSQTSINNKN